MVFPCSWPVYKRKEENHLVEMGRNRRIRIEGPWENLLQALTKLPGGKLNQKVQQIFLSLISSCYLS